MFKNHPKGLLTAALSNMGRTFRLLHHECRASVIPMF